MIVSCSIALLCWFDNLAVGIHRSLEPLILTTNLSFVLLFIISPQETDKTVFQILSFFDQDFLPQRCDCGEAVTFHVNSLLQHLTNTYSTQGITEYSLRYFIKDRGIGCVGWQVHFRDRAVQLSAAHIRRKWFHTEDMDALDKCTYPFTFTDLYQLFLFCEIWLFLKCTA